MSRTIWTASILLTVRVMNAAHLFVFLLNSPFILDLTQSWILCKSLEFCGKESELRPLKCGKLLVTVSSFTEQSSLNNFGCHQYCDFYLTQPQMSQFTGGGKGLGFWRQYQASGRGGTGKLSRCGPEHTSEGHIPMVGRPRNKLLCCAATEPTTPN